MSLFMDENVRACVFCVQVCVCVCACFVCKCECVCASVSVCVLICDTKELEWAKSRLKSGNKLTRRTKRERDREGKKEMNKKGV